MSVLSPEVWCTGTSHTSCRLRETHVKLTLSELAAVVSEQVYQRANKAETVTGKPCRKCGGTLRYVIGGACVPCKNAYQKTLRQRPENKLRMKGYHLQPQVREYHKQYQKTHRDRLREYFVKYDKVREATDKRRLEHRASKYGITAEEYKALLLSQNNACAICNVKLVRPYIDHDHATGRVRGFLCNNCNGGIGLLKDNPDILRNAIAYLTRSR
jgi:hypothetical protein